MTSHFFILYVKSVYVLLFYFKSVYFPLFSCLKYVQTSLLIYFVYGSFATFQAFVSFVTSVSNLYIFSCISYIILSKCVSSPYLSI